MMRFLAPVAVLLSPIAVFAQDEAPTQQELAFAAGYKAMFTCSATFNANGQVRTFTIDGSIQMKSYLTGSPQLHLALNNELVIAGGGKAGYGMIELDNVNFHECVQLDKFENERMLVLEPPHGECC